LVIEPDEWTGCNKASGAIVRPNGAEAASGANVARFRFKKGEVTKATKPDCRQMLAAERAPARIGHDMPVETAVAQAAAMGGGRQCCAHGEPP
jgi:hypothetical protein